MNGKKHLLFGLVLGLVMGWALGFLRFPQLEKNWSFLLGFIASLASVSLVLFLLAARNRNFPPAFSSEKSLAGDSKTTGRHRFIWILLLGVFVLGCLAVGWTVYCQHESFKLQIQNQHKQLQEMAALLEVEKKNDLKPLMNSMLEDLGEELKQHPNRMLRDTSIARIVALSFSFKSYKSMEADSLSENAYSPERGQLLQALVLMNIDSGSFARIKGKTLFAGADLRGANLEGLDLSGINLQGANLKDADLRGANLRGADLGAANLWGANLNRANLSQTNLKRADLSWAQLNEATLHRSNLNGINLTNAQLRKADLTGATFLWAQSVGALFNEANLTSVDFTGSNLTKVNLNQANLSAANLRKINLMEADLAGVRLIKAMVEEKWFNKLKDWRVTGVKELMESYTIVNDTFEIDNRPLYRLKKN